MSRESANNSQSLERTPHGDANRDGLHDGSDIQENESLCQNEPPACTNPLAQAPAPEALPDRLAPRSESEDRLIRSEALLAQAEQLANIGSWEFDIDTRELWWSSHYFRLLGLEPKAEAVPYGTGIRMIHPDDRERGERDADMLVKTGVPFDNELRFVLGDGSLRIFHSRAIGIKNESGRVVRIRGMSQDITERRQAEDKVRESEALLAQAEQIAHLGSYQLDFATQAATLSPNLRKIYAFGPNEEWTLDMYLSRLHPDDRDRVREIVVRTAEERKPFEFVARYLPPEGGLRFIHARGVPILDSAGKLVRRVGVVQDITEQRKADEQLRASEALLAEAEQIAHVGSWKYDRISRTVELSKQLLQMFGVSSESEWGPEDYWEQLHPDDRDRAQKIADRAIAAGEPYEYVARYYSPEGEFRTHFVRGLPFRNAHGTIEYWIGVVQDITDQKHAEEDLRRLSQELLRTRDDDRRQMARELHESAGQSLAALKMTLARLKEALGQKRDLARSLLQSATELADGAIREVRTISYVMHPPLLDEAGLVPALRWYAKGFAERSGIDTTVEIAEDFPRQSREIETTVFRIVQEALTNLLRYSGSKTARIRVTEEQGQILAEIRDQGCGLAQPAPKSGWRTPLGVGISGMRERVKQLNGVFEIESVAGRGTTVRATLPRQATPAQDEFARETRIDIAKKPKQERAIARAGRGRARMNGENAS